MSKREVKEDVIETAEVEVKEEPKPNPIPNSEILKLIKSGIPVKEARFHAAVNNGDGAPEMQFNDKSSFPGRRVQMWASYAYLVCLHWDAKKGDRYILVPLSNVIFAHAK